MAEPVRRRLHLAGQENDGDGRSPASDGAGRHPATAGAARAGIFAALGLDKDGVAGRITVYVGGPVERGRPFLIHTPDMTMKESKRLPGGVVLTNDPAMLRAVGQGKGPAKHLFALGYVG